MSGPTGSVDRRGLAVLAWALIAALLTGVVVELSGLRWVQGVVWPSDLYTFQQVERGPLDVVVVGSSRAAFGISSSVLDQCLSDELDRPTHSANLSRAFATSYALDLLTEDLLGGSRRPRVLVIGAEPELFDEHNPRIHNNLATTPGLADLPGSLAYVRDPATLFGAASPIGRGPTTLALYLSGRWDSKAWLRWLMLHHGGSIFCGGSPQCDTHNAAVEATLDGWWDVVSRTLLPTLKESRFPDYQVGTGPMHAHTERLLERMERGGTRVVMVELPRLDSFASHIPPEVEPAYRPYLEALIQEHKLAHHPASDGRWARSRPYFVDGEHLNAQGAERMSRELCRETLAPLLRALDAEQGG